MNENFSLTSGILEVSSSGKFMIVKSQIFQNYAIQSPIGLIFETAELSVIDSTNFFQNEPLTPENILVEITSNCNKL